MKIVLYFPAHLAIEFRNVLSQKPRLTHKAGILRHWILKILDISRGRSSRCQAYQFWLAA